MKTVGALFVLGLALLAGGCATTYQVAVSALAAPGLADGGRSYVFVSGSPSNRNTDDLQTQEVLGYVRQALSPRGFQLAGQPDAAQLNIFVDYGIGNPVTHVYTFATPVYAEFGGRIIRQTRTTKDAQGNSVTTAQTVVVPGRYERVGSDVTVGSVTTYRKYLRLSARLRQPGAPAESGQEAWTITALMDDPQTDLRAALPLLAAAITPYAGQNTHQAILLRFRMRNGRPQLLPSD